METEAENERMLKVIEKLMDKGKGLSPEEEKLLKLLTRLVEDFEERYYHPKDATPLEVLQHLMESREVKQTHLWEVFGSKGIASEVLNGKRGSRSVYLNRMVVDPGTHTLTPRLSSLSFQAYPS